MVTLKMIHKDARVEDYGFNLTVPIGFSHESTAMLWFMLLLLAGAIWHG